MVELNKEAKSHEIPNLEGQAADAVAYRGTHMQIIASAGSGKTETVSQRIAMLVTQGIDPANIVAFTFTEKAASELKERVRDRVSSFAGPEKADKLGTMYVGTIHGFCYQMLTQYIGKYETYDVIDENQLAAFLQRQQNFLKLKDLSVNGGQFDGMNRFRQNLAVVENELLDLDFVPEPLRLTIQNFYTMLDEFRLLTFGLQVARAVEVLNDPEVHRLVTNDIKYLIVDEYQDVNPAQEKLIQLLAKPIGSADLVVVGDDDQAIYQWRGSTVSNITTFETRYPNVKKFELLKNRRSRPQIVELADNFAQSITGRISKKMESSRLQNGPAVDIVLDYDNEEQEADEIALSINKLRSIGFRYSDMAVLVRGKVAYPRILQAFEKFAIPVQPGGRSGLFEQPDADFLGRCFAWLVDYEWRKGKYSKVQESISLTSLIDLAKTAYSLSTNQLKLLEESLLRAKKLVGTDTRDLSLIAVTYSITEALGIRNWDINNPLFQSRLGTVARFSKFIADYESMQRRSRIAIDGDGSQAGYGDQGDWYFKNLAALMLNIAIGDYTDFEGEEDLLSDSVALMTVHAAKGLEWQIVFVPSLTKKRFPSSNTGKKTNWIIDRQHFDAERYEGTDSDERRLFYVAVTRAREWLALSSHERVNATRGAISPYIKEVYATFEGQLAYPVEWAESSKVDESPELQITYSELAAYLNCGYSFWLRNRIGFPPELVQEIGYGKAVHHLLRAIAEETQRTNRVLNPADIDRILATDFFLPFAGKAVATRFRESARNLVNNYMDNFGTDMQRVWATERPFELALDGVVVSGRADVILDQHGGSYDSLAIVDYKTAIDERELGLQLQVYTEAGIREGLSVDGAFLHDLDAQERLTVDISPTARQSAISVIVNAAQGIKNRNFDANPEKSRCSRCDVRAFCPKVAK